MTSSHKLFIIHSPQGTAAWMDETIDLFSDSFEDWKSKIKVSEGLVSSKTSLLGF
jgi:hypothetical protein